MIPPRVVPVGDWVHDEDLDPSARAGGKAYFFFIGACLYVCVCVFYSYSEKFLKHNYIHNFACESHIKKLHLDFPHFRVNFS